ncbi:1-phosphofructokinase [Heyndrickxia camelliae]|uniref:Tagatose-6-phosphate kinase n=1 Tax=Heyndrickxia camelliae TaxID=1707093 RepID=A0A2N3LGI7_9BACI|nr:1-phosphofructokinase [Heyndrickxia camelliae]PKR83709.1 1-phosphofructokinase [Heyndrickxia camelliae]
MIYTCTMNPAIDLFTEFEQFSPFVVNRSIFEDYQANGKAINISFMLKKMNIHSTATGFLGGFTGGYIEQELRRNSIDVNFIKVDGITRINTFIRSGELEYKAVNKGPEISKKAQEELLNYIKTFTSEDMLFVSGSLPKGIKDEIFVAIAELSQKQGFSLILDISSDRLIDCLSYHPYLIKPNDEELAQLLGVEKLDSEKELANAAKLLLDKGAKRILVSRGEKGALYVDEETILWTTAPKGKVVNTACAGDTMLAVFIGKIIETGNVEEALISATAAGSSTAFTAGLSNLEDIPLLREQIQLKREVI